MTPGDGKERAMPLFSHHPDRPAPDPGAVPARPPLDLMQPEAVATATFALG
jgi:hypothetical protein